MSSQNQTVLLITGANTGIGYATVRSLLNSSTPYHILLAARSQGKADGAVTDLRPVVVDIESDESIEALLKTVQNLVDRIDVLINNAGVELDATGPKRGLTTRQIFATTWNTNVAGSHILTSTLIPLLLKSSTPRLIFLTSGTASLALTFNPSFILNRPPPAGWPKPPQRELPAYKASKVALNMIMRDWDRVLRNDGVKVWTVNPGFLVTGLGGDQEILVKMGAGDPGEGGRLVRSVVEGERDEDVGKTVQKEGVLGW